MLKPPHARQGRRCGVDVVDLDAFWSEGSSVDVEM
jgi:hypothetical protein